MKLYYHKTDGGAEYLTDKYITVKNYLGGSHKEGIMKGANYVVRIDGDIEKDAELMIADKVFEDIIKNYKKGKKYPF